MGLLEGKITNVPGQGAGSRPASPSALAQMSARFSRPMGHLLMRAVRPILRPIQQARRSQFSVLGGPPPGRIVFLGDSITEGGMWDEWFPEVDVLNRGVGGERSDDVLRRLDTAVNAPVAVFLLVGTNDVSFGRRIDAIVRDVASIVTGIEDRAPGTPVFLQSVMPRKAQFRDDVTALNERYRALASATPHTRYVDLWPVLADPDGALRPEMTRDKLHLTGEGYQAWVGVLRPHVDHAVQVTRGDAAGAADVPGSRG